jgi:hypothetical protein
MKPSLVVSILILTLITSAWVIIIFGSNDRSDILPSMAGCFRSTNYILHSDIKITSSGDFISVSQRARVTITKDKQSVSFLPDKKIIIQFNENTELSMQSGFPLLIRISPDRRSFLVPSEEGPGVRFIRVPCSA